MSGTKRADERAGARGAMRSMCLHCVSEESTKYGRLEEIVGEKGWEIMGG